MTPIKTNIQSQISCMLLHVQGYANLWIQHSGKWKIPHFAARGSGERETSGAAHLWQNIRPHRSRWTLFQIHLRRWSSLTFSSVVNFVPPVLTFSASLGPRSLRNFCTDLPIPPSSRFSEVQTKCFVWSLSFFFHVGSTQRTWFVNGTSFWLSFRFSWCKKGMSAPMYGIVNSTSSNRDLST